MDRPTKYFIVTLPVPALTKHRIKYFFNFSTLVQKLNLKNKKEFSVTLSRCWQNPTKNFIVTLPVPAATAACEVLALLASLGTVLLSTLPADLVLTTSLLTSTGVVVALKVS